MYKYIVLGYLDKYFVKDHSEFHTKYSETDVIKMPEIRIDNIDVELSGQIFQQTVGIPKGTNCAPLTCRLISLRV